MKTILVRTAWVLVVLGLLVVVALKIFLPTDRLAAMAAERIRATTGAEVAYGEVSLDLWPRIALTVRDVDLRGAPEDPGQAGGLESWHVRVGELSGGLALRPLLSRRAELDRVRLVQPVLEMTTRPTAAGTARAAGGEGGDDHAPVALVAAGAEVVDGTLVWTERGGRHVRLSGWQQDVDATELGRLAALLTAWAEAGSSPAGAEPGELNLHGRAALLSLAGFRPGAPMDFRDFTLDGRLVVTPGSPVLALKDLDAAWAGLHATGAGTVTPPGVGGRLQLDWALRDLDAARAQPALASLLPDSQAAVREWLASVPIALPSLTADGSLDLPLPLPEGPASETVMNGLVVRAQVDGAEVTPPRLERPWTVDAKVDLAQAQLRISDVRAVVDQGELTGSLTVGHVGRPNPHCSLDAELDGLPVSLLLELFAPRAVPYLVGDADGAVRGRFRLGKPEELRSSLALTGEAVLNDGVIHASEWLSSISKYLGDRQDLKEIDYSSLRHKLEVVDGRYRIHDLNLRGKDTDWTGEGWLGLDGAIDMRLQAKLPPGFTPDLGMMTPLAEALRGEDGRLALNLSLTGRAARPTVGLDLGNAQNLLQQSLQGSNENNLQNQLDTMLQGEQGKAVVKGVQGLLDKLKKRR